MLVLHYIWFSWWSCTHTLIFVDTRIRDIASRYAATRSLEKDCLWLELLYKMDLHDLLNTQQFRRDTRSGKDFCLLRSVMQPTLMCRGSEAPNADGRTCRLTVYIPDQMVLKLLQRFPLGKRCNACFSLHLIHLVKLHTYSHICWHPYQGYCFKVRCYTFPGEGLSLVGAVL